MSENDRFERIELVEERLEVGKREVERGRVVVRTRVDTREEIAEAALRREDVGVERVSVGRVVREAPAVREEDGVTIIPVLEERLVTTTELVLEDRDPDHQARPHGALPPGRVAQVGMRGRGAARGADRGRSHARTRTRGNRR